MKKVILTIVLVAITAAVVNDVSYYAKARYELNNIATETVDHAASGEGQTRDKNARESARFAATRGATLVAYDEKDNRVYVWLQMPVENTWVFARAMALLASQPLDTPYLIHTDKSTAFR